MITTTKKGEWFEITISNGYIQYTIDELFRSVWQAPKKLTHQMRTAKDVYLNGEPANWNMPLQDKDRLQLKVFTDKDFGLIPFYQEIEVLYEDDHLLVVNKPSGINTHPNLPEQTDTLANAVAYHLQAKGELRAVKHIHRLDRDTSGTILFSKHALIGTILDRMLEERTIKRTYVALVHGSLNKKKGTIDAPIGRDRHHPTRRRVSPGGQKAVTHFEVIERKSHMTKIKCQLDTGRTHQIRVHLSHLGHPIVGDPLYGEKRELTRLALHAESLQFIHPFTKESIDVEAPINW